MPNFKNKMSSYTNTILTSDTNLLRDLSRDVIGKLHRVNDHNLKRKLQEAANDIMLTADRIESLQNQAKNCRDEQRQIQLDQQIFDEMTKSIDQISVMMKICSTMIPGNMQGDIKKELKVMELGKKSFKIAQSIYNLELKAQKLKREGHDEAADTTRQLVDTIDKELSDKKNRLTNNLTKCRDAFAAARPELEKHRDSNYLYANLMLAVLTAGVGFLFAALANKAITGNFLFFKTDTASKADQLEKDINEVSETSNKLRKEATQQEANPEQDNNEAANPVTRGG